MSASVSVTFSIFVASGTRPWEVPLLTSLSPDRRVSTSRSAADTQISFVRVLKIVGKTNADMDAPIYKKGGTNIKKVETYGERSQLLPRLQLRVERPARERGTAEHQHSRCCWCCIETSTGSFGAVTVQL